MQSTTVAIDLAKHVFELTFTDARAAKQDGLSTAIPIKEQLQSFRALRCDEPNAYAIAA